MTIRKPARLLLVDDDPGLLKLLGMRLVSEGYSVVTAESGPEALRVLGREKVDLVISDLRMDEMDGLQLFSEIQKGHPGMPVIILTAHGSIPDAVAATQQGVFSFLTSSSRLASAVNRARRLAWKFDISSAADIPFPDTSAIQNPATLSDSCMKS